MSADNSQRSPDADAHSPQAWTGVPLGPPDAVPYRRCLRALEWLHKILQSAGPAVRRHPHTHPPAAIPGPGGLRGLWPTTHNPCLIRAG